MKNLIKFEDFYPVNESNTDDLQDAYNNAMSKMKEIKAAIKTFERMKEDYNNRVKNYSKIKLDEYVKVISDAFTGDGKVTIKKGDIVISLKSKQYRSKGAILDKIPKLDGKNVFNVNVLSSNSYGEIKSASLSFTKQFLDNVMSIKMLPELKV